MCIRDSGDIELEGLRVLGGDVVVQSVDALEDDDLVLFELERLGGLEHAHLAGELVLRHEYPLAARELGEVLVEEVHVHALGALEVDVALLGARRSGGVDGAEVVVHADGVGPDPALGQLLSLIHI